MGLDALLAGPLRAKTNNSVDNPVGNSVDYTPSQHHPFITNRGANLRMYDSGDGSGQETIDRSLPGDYPLVNMSDFMFMRQGRTGNIHLEGYVTIFDPDRPNTLLSVSPWGFMKTQMLEDLPDGTRQFVVVKGWDIRPDVTYGRPLELYQIIDGKIFIRYEEMNWDNKEYREHIHPDGTPSFEWTKDNAKPYEVQYRQHADYVWHYCDDPDSDYRTAFDEYAYFPTRVFDLTVENWDNVAAELNEAYAVDNGWLDFPRQMGHPDAHVLFVANDYYWGRFGPQDPRYNDVYIGIENRWQIHERYKYMALKLPTGDLLPSPRGLVGACWFTHPDQNTPMVKQDGVLMNKMVIEDKGIEPLLACESSPFVLEKPPLPRRLFPRIPRLPQVP